MVVAVILVVLLIGCLAIYFWEEREVVEGNEDWDERLNEQIEAELLKYQDEHPQEKRVELPDEEEAK